MKVKEFFSYLFAGWIIGISVVFLIWLTKLLIKSVF